ncbi:hypothetical protein V5O48_013535 [Marasmius crinis-equi]|uniref:Uncharacterized protein n=1 Tax=Marasmius crinis-equi TaxID=585013 RepID=A0ABR3EZT6_9AGAR
MSGRLSQPTGSSFGFFSNIQALARAPQSNDRSRLTATLTVHILEFEDVGAFDHFTRLFHAWIIAIMLIFFQILILTPLVKSSHKAGSLAVRYMVQEREAESGISCEMVDQVDKLIRTLEEILEFYCYFLDTCLELPRPLPRWISRILIMWKIKKLRATIRTLKHKIQTLTVEIQRFGLVSVIQDREERVNTRQLPLADIVDRSSSQLPVEETPPSNRSITLEQTLDPTVHSAGPDQGGSPDPPSQVSPPVGPRPPPSPTAGFFAGARDFVIVVLPGASIRFTHVDGNQSIVTNS